MRQIILTIFSVFTLQMGASQMEFVDILSGVDNSFNTGLVGTPDSGWITVYLQAQPTGAIRHDLVVDRYDACGILLGSRSYHFPNEMNLAIQQAYSDPLDHSLWVLLHSYGANDRGVLCHFNTDGELVNHNLIELTTADYYPYTVARNKKGELAVYGNVQGGSTITLFKDDLSILSRNALHRTVSWGSFLPTSDGGYVCRSGNVIYKVDADFQFVWSKALVTFSGTFQPVEVEDGYIFAYFPYGGSQQKNLLVKLDKSTGELIWVSRDVEGSGLSRIQILKNGTIAQIGEAQPDGSAFKHIYISLFDSGSGAIIDQFTYSPDPARHFIGNQLLELPNGQFIITGHGSFYSHGVNMMINSDFSSSCSSVLFNQSSDAPDLDFMEYNPQSHFYSLDSDTTPVIETTPQIFAERICEVNDLDISGIKPIDTILCAGSSITLDYTSVPYNLQWSDGSNERIRTILAPADLQLILSECEAEETVPIRLDTMDCTCDLYVPTAFSPNDDGINDVFTVFPSCTFIDYHLEIYDRFGARVFESFDIDSGWDGNAKKGKQMTPGVYVALINYTVSENTIPINKRVAQDVTLMR